MSAWRRVALEMLPERRHAFKVADGPMALWNALWDGFCSAYATDPPDDDRIRRTFTYARWCLEDPSRVRDAGHDVATAAVVCFYEDLPTFAPARRDLHRWMEPSEFRGLSVAFTYHLTPKQLSNVEAENLAMHRRRRPRALESAGHHELSAD